MTTTTAPEKTALLPAERTPQRKGIDGKKILVYGAAKVGKTTLAANLDEHALFIATEAGQDALDAFRVPVDSWQTFRSIGQELATTEHEFKTIVVDTIDELARLCVDDVVQSLADSASMRRDQYIHANDFGYGKGPDAIAQEFRLRIAKFCNLGLTVVFLAHERTETVKTRTGLEITKIRPEVGMRKLRDWLLGFVDLIVYAATIQTTEGERRILQLKPSETVEAGGRVPDAKRDEMPDTIALSAEELKATLGAAFS